MKKPCFSFFICVITCLQVNAQSQVYSVPAIIIDQYVRDSIHVIGQLDLTFPEDGQVLVQFDGEGFGSPQDRIILAANNYPEWQTNEGNVNFMSQVEGEVHCFSHTRIYPVTAGQQSFYAVVTNYVEENGSGRATVYGRLSVEYIPQSSSVSVANSIRVENFDVMQKVALDSVTIEASGPGMIEVRLNGSGEPSQGDILLIGISESKNWSYTDPQNIALEHNNQDESAISFSNTKLINVDEAGPYTFYAMMQRGFEEEGNGYAYMYTNLHARFYPQTGENLLRRKFIQEDNLILDEHLKLLDSITINVPDPGKVEIRFDGALQSPLGSKILIAANDQPAYSLQEGSVLLQTNENDLDRHPFVHTQVVEVEPGEHTFYAMAEHHQGLGAVSVDVNGHFLVKYYPEVVVSATDHLTNISFEIFPNPANQLINIQPDESSTFTEMTVYDLNGRSILQDRSFVNGDGIDVSALTPGMYIVEVRNEEGSGFGKFIKE